MSKTTRLPEVSIVIPCHNEEGNIGELLHRLAEVLSGERYEVVCVDDGSTDGTLGILRHHAKTKARVRYVSFSRNFGHQAALRAGLAAASGRAVISMDADLQHPPALIPTMLEHWRNGYQVVYTVRHDSGGNSLFKRLTSQWFYTLMNFLSDVHVEEGAADFRLMGRKVVDLVNAQQEADIFLRGYISWLGFRQIGLPYTPDKRFSGQSKYSFRKMVSLAGHGVTQFSVRPLRLAFILASGAFGVSLVYMLYAVWVGLVNNSSVPGWLSLVVLFVFLQGIQFLLLGLIGEYLGRTFMQTKHRPEYVVAETDVDGQDD